MPTLSPSSLRVYEDSSLPKGLPARGARRPATPCIVVLQRKVASPDECPGVSPSRRVKSRWGPADDRVVVSERNGVNPAAPLLALSVALTIAALTSKAADWRPAALILVLFALAVASDVMIVEMRGVRVSGAFFSLVLAMVLLGPAPAMAIGISVTVIDAALSRRPFVKAFNDAAVWAIFPLLGGLLAEALITDPSRHGLAFCAVVVLVFMTTNMLNFVLVASY